MCGEEIFCAFQKKWGKKTKNSLFHPFLQSNMQHDGYDMILARVATTQKDA
jgi:hypothetical protein